MLIRWSHVSSGTKRRSVRSTIASKDAEIAALKANMSELYARYNALGRENRQLSTRNSELSAAYNGLKEILRNRGVETP